MLRARIRAPAARGFRAAGDRDCRTGAICPRIRDHAGAARCRRIICVKDIALADFGRKELVIAETEMPGLMACARNSAPASR
jgi:hypothetical protein